MSESSQRTLERFLRFQLAPSKELTERKEQEMSRPINYTPIGHHGDGAMETLAYLQDNDERYSDFDPLDDGFPHFAVNRKILEERKTKMEDAKVDTTQDNESTYKPLYRFMIAGVQHHRIKDVLSQLEDGKVLALVTEPSNKFDPNAIRIEFVDMDGTQTMLGYVPKKISAEVSAKITVGRSLECILIRLDKLAKPWEMAMVEIREVL